MDVAGAADVLLRRLRHERRRDPVQEGDLLDPVLVDRMAVGGGDRVGVARIDLVLAVPGLALGELDRDPGGVHPAADRPQVLLVHRRRQDVVVEDVGDRRRQVLDSPSRRPRRSSPCRDRTRARRRTSACSRPRARARTARSGSGAARRPRGSRRGWRRRRAPARFDRATGSGAACRGRGRSRSRRSRPPSWPSRSRAPGPSPCRARAGSCSPRSRARPRPRGSTRPGSACRTGAPACR